MNTQPVCHTPAGRVVRFTKERTEPIVLLDPKDKEIERLKKRSELTNIYIELYQVHSDLYQECVAFLRSRGLLQEFQQFATNLKKQ